MHADPHVTALPKPLGHFEAHLTVSELDRSISFCRNVVNLPLALELPERGTAFFWIGGPGQAMLGLCRGAAATMLASWEAYAHIAASATGRAAPRPLGSKPRN